MTPATLRARSRVLRNLVTIVLAVLLFVLAVELSMLMQGRHGGARFLIHRLPLLFYLWAIWNARQAIAAVGRGDGFGAILPRLIGRVGLALFLGALINVFFAPWLSIALGWSSTIAYYDVAAITVGVVGATLMVLGQLLREAVLMREELDEIL